MTIDPMTAAQSGPDKFTLFRLKTGSHFRTVTVRGRITGVNSTGDSVTVTYVNSGGDMYMDLYRAPTWSLHVTRSLGRMGR